MANYDIFIFDGHGEGDCGAVGNGKQEHTEAKRFNDKVCEYLKPTGLSIHRSNGKNNYKNCLLAGNTYRYKFGITTHLNSSTNTTATGIEALVPAKEKSFNLETNILSRVSKEIGLQNRGIKSRDYNTNTWYKRSNGQALNFKDWFKEIREAWNNGISLTILELAFISNASDMKLFDSKFDAFAFIVAEEIARACDKTITKPSTSSSTSTGTNTGTSTKGLHRVKADGKQIGSYGVQENVLNAVKKAMNDGASNIIIEKI